MLYKEFASLNSTYGFVVLGRLANGVFRRHLNSSMSTWTGTMSTKTESKSDVRTSGLNISNFKAIQAPRREAGIQDDQLAISKHSISLPAAVANKLGPQVALLYSDADKAIAIRKAQYGDFKLKQVGRLKSTKAIYAKSIIEVKKIKPGKYSTNWDEKNSMLIARVA